MTRVFYICLWLLFSTNVVANSPTHRSIAEFVSQELTIPTLTVQQFGNNKVFKTDSSQLYKMPNGVVYQYKRPKICEWVGNTFRNLYHLPQIAVHPNAIPTWITVAGTTAITYYYDGKLISLAQRSGNWLGIPGDDTRGLNTSNKRINLFNNRKIGLYIPGDIGYAMYYIGDGLTDISIMLGFLSYGLIKDDYRSLRVASELTEGLASVGIAIQLLKRSFGRQSPWVADITGYERGAWHPFSKDYNNDVPGHDAMPSGHMATSTMVLIVIGDNYPEYRWIYPTGIGLMALLGYQMMNNGVHWISDYPLGIVVGYAMGKMVVARGRKKATLAQASGALSQKKSWNYDVTPVLSPYFSGVTAKVSF